MNITKEQFLEIYAGTPAIQYINLFYKAPASDYEYRDIHLRNKLWRMNNIYTVIDKRGNKVKFVMNLAQHIVFATLMKNPRVVILKSRQQGISTFFLVYFFDSCITRSHFTSGLMAQGRQEAKSLLERTKVLWECLNPNIKKVLGVEKGKDSADQFGFTNRSTMVVATNFRGWTLQGGHISEMGKIANKYPERAREVLTGTIQTLAEGNILGMESTAEGENIFKRIWDSAMGFAGERTAKDFFPIFLSWLKDPTCNLEADQVANAEAKQYFRELEAETGTELTRTQRNFWIQKKRELGNDIYQEYPATPEEAFLKNREGAYYAHLYMEFVKGQGREINDLYDPNLPVYAAMDIGMNDLFVIIYFQVWRDGWHIIDCYYNHTKGIQHYCDEMDRSDYDVETVVLPHDAVKRDLTSHKTVEEAFHEFGYNDTIVVDRTNSVNDDIEHVRQAIKRLFIDPKAQYAIDCFLNYTKDWDDGNMVYKNKPLHNHYSHGADAIRQMVLSGLDYSDYQPIDNVVANL